MRKAKLAIGMILALALIACAMTPKQRYYSTLKVWDDNIETYLAAYKTAPPATQDKWKANIDPWIKAANSALEVWHQNLSAPDGSAKEQAWLDAQRKAMVLLIQAGILKIDGGK